MSFSCSYFMLKARHSSQMWALLGVRALSRFVRLFSGFLSKKQRNPFILFKHENPNFHKILCTACVLETLLPQSHGNCDYYVTCIVSHQ